VEISVGIVRDASAALSVVILIVASAGFGSVVSAASLLCGSVDLLPGAMIAAAVAGFAPVVGCTATDPLVSTVAPVVEIAAVPFV